MKSIFIMLNFPPEMPCFEDVCTVYKIHIKSAKYGTITQNKANRGKHWHISRIIGVLFYSWNFGIYHS